MENIFVLGSINLDYIIQVNSIPDKGETALGGNIQKAYGGKGANQAVACSKLGGKVTMIGAVGDDTEGTKMVENLAFNNIATDYVSVENSSSGVAMILVDDEDNQIVVSPGANKLVTFEQVKNCLDEEAESGDYLVAQFENDLHTVFESIKYANKMGLKTILNPSPYQLFDIEFLQYVDYVIVNETELSKITKEELTSDKLDRLSDYSNVILTLGKDGSVYHSKEHHITVPSIKVKTVDTTAAGDTFLGAFILGIINGLSIEDNLKRANKAGAFATTKIGAQTSMPTLEELEIL